MNEDESESEGGENEGKEEKTKNLKKRKIKNWLKNEKEVQKEKLKKLT